MQALKWYGRGPHESYSDRFRSALLGVYEGSTSEQLEPYEYPQESGNKLDTRWISFTDNNGNSLMILSDTPINASALLFTAQELDRAKHQKDLTPHGSVCVHLDTAQNGVGNHSCGPEPMEQYKLYPRRESMTLRLIPFNEYETNEETLYRNNTE